MLNISNHIKNPNTCDIRKIENDEDINMNEKVSESILAISNGEKYIATINKINGLLEELLGLPATSCGSKEKKSRCNKRLRLISVECKRALSNPINSHTCPHRLKSQLLTASGI